MKTCNACGVEKEDSEFYAKSGRRCRLCWAARCREYNAQNKEKLAVHRRTYAAKNKGKLAALNHKSSMKRKYGITPEQRNELLANQDGKCRICLRSDKRLVVDHCHKTGVVRMLLCDHCNRGLGCFMDDPALLIKAAEVIGAYMDCRTDGRSRR